jgi:hypothetical protein
MISHAAAILIRFAWLLSFAMGADVEGLSYRPC